MSLDLEKGILYAKKFFSENKTFTGGSSRVVFILDSKKVLKIAKNEAGIDQNKEEIKNSRRYPLVVTRIFKVGTNNNYIISELVRPAQSGMELVKFFGFDIINDISNLIDNFVSPIKKKQSYERVSKNEASMQLLDMVRSGTDFNDISRIDHWGKTNDGRYILLDHGANETIIKKYYQKNDFGNYNGSYENF